MLQLERTERMARWLHQGLGLGVMQIATRLNRSAKVCEGGVIVVLAILQFAIEHLAGNGQNVETNAHLQASGVP